MILAKIGLSLGLNTSFFLAGHNCTVEEAISSDFRGDSQDFMPRMDVQRPCMAKLSLGAQKNTIQATYGIRNASKREGWPFVMWGNHI